jgi:hypothetical protein
MLTIAKRIGICLCALVAIVAVYTGVNIASASDDRGNWTNFAVHNMGKPINSQWAEGELSFADDGTLVFCSGRTDLGAAAGDPRDLYIATFNIVTRTWNMPINMGTPVNAPPATNIDLLRKGDDREPWITPDGNTIYFKSDRFAVSGSNMNDIFVTHKVGGVWQPPELVGFPVSTDAGNEHCPMLMKNGELCFASNRSGGYGGFDIWCSMPNGDGGWMDPVNQGPNINTTADEYHFIDDKKGKRVFFSSGRQPGGQGLMDIWTSKLEKGKCRNGSPCWGPAVNLGPAINKAGITLNICPAFSPDYKAFHWISTRKDSSFDPTDKIFSFDIFWTDYENVKDVFGDDDDQ